MGGGGGGGSLFYSSLPSLLTSPTVNFDRFLEYSYQEVRIETPYSRFSRRWGPNKAFFVLCRGWSQSRETQ
jgi:hypothetical protein